MSINRLVATWSGLTGLPGVSTFYLRSAVTDVSGVVTFFDSLAPLLPFGLTITVPAVGDVLDEVSGNLTGAWAGSGGGVVGGGGSSAETYAAGTGFRVEWLTGTVADGRRVRGRTFIAPVRTALFDGTGTIQNANIATALAAASALVATDNTVIWHRPKLGVGGSIADIIGASIPDKVTSLRTRRN